MRSLSAVRRLLLGLVALLLVGAGVLTAAPAADEAPRVLPLLVLILISSDGASTPPGTSGSSTATTLLLGVGIGLLLAAAVATGVVVVRRRDGRAWPGHATRRGP